MKVFIYKLFFYLQIGGYVYTHLNKNVFSIFSISIFLLLSLSLCFDVSMFISLVWASSRVSVSLSVKGVNIFYNYVIITSVSYSSDKVLSQVMHQLINKNKIVMKSLGHIFNIDKRYRLWSSFDIVKSFHRTRPSLIRNCVENILQNSHSN